MKTQVPFQRSVRIIFAGLFILLLAGCTDLGMAQSTENSHNKSNNMVAAPITTSSVVIPEKSQVPLDKPSEDKLLGQVSEYLSSNSLLMYYRTPLENVMHIYKMDAMLGNPSIIADIPQESPQMAIVDRTSSRALFAVSASEIVLVDCQP